MGKLFAIAFVTLAAMALISHAPSLFGAALVVGAVSLLLPSGAHGRPGRRPRARARRR